MTTLPQGRETPRFPALWRCGALQWWGAGRAELGPGWPCPLLPGQTGPPRPRSARPRRLHSPPFIRTPKSPAAYKTTWGQRKHVLFPKPRVTTWFLLSLPGAGAGLTPARVRGPRSGPGRSRTASTGFESVPSPQPGSGTAAAFSSAVLDRKVRLL